MKYKYLWLLLLLPSCASSSTIRGGPETTACGAALDLRIEGYFAGCDYIVVDRVIRIGKDSYISEGECIKRRKSY